MTTATANYAKLMVRDQLGRMMLAGTRYQVALLASEHISYHWSAEDLQENHPDLSPEQIDAALAYFYDHRAEVEAELAANDKEWVEGRAASKQSSYEELKARMGK
ncbi:MAG: DUF433 domain-containing protein [Planctomycetota bacterium]